MKILEDSSEIITVASFAETLNKIKSKHQLSLDEDLMYNSHTQI
jgi:hypothetical protein